MNRKRRLKIPYLTDSGLYTPVWGAGFGTVSNSSGCWRVIGDMLQVFASCTVGTAAASLATVSLPFFFNLDVNKIPINNTSGNPGQQWGTYTNAEALASAGGFIVTAPATSTSLVYCGSSLVNVASHLTPANGSSVTASSVVFAVAFTVPIVGRKANRYS